MKKYCCEIILPSDGIITPYNLLRLEGIALIHKLWPNGITLNVRFLEGTQAQQDMVKSIAPQWSQFANIIFTFDNTVDGHIRITFNPNDGAWSTVGKDALSVPIGQPTMNLGWVDEAVILHEFGHAIGLGHEHQNPEGGIQWNKEVVYADLAGPPNFWNRPTVDHNIFARYATDQIHATTLDRDSIMMYPIPNEWTLNDFETLMSQRLSDLDKAFVGRLYPLAAPNPMTELPVNQIAKVQAEIGQSGEEDLFTFDLEEDGVYTIQTEGNTDVYMSLFGGENQNVMIAEDDDSGQDRNARISEHLTQGTYQVQVRHYNSESGTGNYSIYILKEEALLG